jgi:hypothetical protein
MQTSTFALTDKGSDDTRPGGRYLVILRLSVRVALWTGWLASLTRTVKVNVPVFVGLPVSAPDELRVSPPGRFPEMRDHVYGVVPPEACRVTL